MNRKNRQVHNKAQTAMAVDDWVNDTLGSQTSSDPSYALNDLEDTQAPPEAPVNHRMGPSVSATPMCEDTLESGISSNVSEMGAKELLAFLTSKKPQQSKTVASSKRDILSPQPSVQQENEEQSCQEPLPSERYEPKAPAKEREKSSVRGNAMPTAAPFEIVPHEKDKRLPFLESLGAIDAAAGQAIFERLKSQITSVPSNRTSMKQEDYYRAMTNMPIFRRKNQVYGNRRADAAEVTVRTFADEYRAALPVGSMEDCGANAMIQHVANLFAKSDKSLSPEKRIQVLLKDPSINQGFAEVGEALAARLVETSPDNFIAAGRYIFGGNYMDLSSGSREDKEAFGRAYSQFFGEYLAESVSEARSNDDNQNQCVTILLNDGMLVDFYPLREVPEDFRCATISRIKGISALHHPEVPDAGLVEGECFIVPDGMTVGDAESLSFLLAPEGGLFFSEGDREYGCSFAYSYFQAAMGPCRVVLKNDAPLSRKEFMASFLRTQPTIRMASGGTEGPRHSHPVFPPSRR